MATTVILGFLAAFGLLSALWVGAGLFFPAKEGGAAVVLCGPGLKEESFIRRWCWLRELGAVRGSLLVIDRGLNPEERNRLAEYRFVEFCSLEELAARLELERNQIERTGT